VAQASFAEIIKRHETLRTVFINSEEGPLQLIRQHFNFEIKQVDLTRLSTQAQEQAINTAILADATGLFDLSKDLMLRVSYYRLSSKEGVMLFNMHHIASDGWSIGVLVKEFVSLYQTILQGTVTTLEPLAVQYADYAHWQRNWLQGEVLENQLKYWDRQLADLPVVHGLPLDYERPQIQTFNGAVHHFKIDGETLESLNSLALEQKATPFMLVHAVFAIVLSRYSNSSDIVMGTAVANRLQKELESLIGFFVNTLILRVNVNADCSFTDYLKEVKNVNLNAQENQDVPFEHLVDRLNPTRSTSHNALFQIMLNMNTTEKFEFSIADVELSSYSKVRRKVTAKFDLSLTATAHYGDENNRADSGLYCALEYNCDIFSEKTIARLAKSMQRVFKAVASDARQKIKQLPLLSTKETNYLLQGLNQTQQNFANNQCIQQLFEDQVIKTPDNIALIFAGVQLTYAQYNQHANQLAHYLLEQGVKKGDFVGVYLRRSLEMMIAVMAVLKTGAAYLPLDPNNPEGRSKDMMSDCGLKIVLCTDNLTDKLSSSGAQLVVLDQHLVKQKLSTYAVSNPVIKGMNNSLIAYMIYTSGSTGKPKGVTVEHKSIVNYFGAIDHYINSIDAAIFITNLSFDGTLSMLYPPLIKGMFIKIIPDNNDKFEALAEALSSNQYRYLFKLTPSFIDAARTFIKTVDQGIRHTIILGGEALYRETYNYWSQLLPDSSFINHYGPTETTVGCSSFAIDKDKVKNYPNGLPIGKPLANYQFYILDQYRNLVPFGSVGELHIGG
ncbi:MAG TPA: non-ribosomal peptide synthetase, partial [Oceanospirillales bacterium]|nr:non-ribosomal peptide synthetase [Oceanospirillales bacterium]